LPRDPAQWGNKFDKLFGKFNPPFVHHTKNLVTDMSAPLNASGLYPEEITEIQNFNEEYKETFVSF
jgi:hypothetical protein